jgi:glycoprotein endo-alpha-1,2-mannosidase
VFDATLTIDVQSKLPVTSVQATLETYAPTIPSRSYQPEEPRDLQFIPNQSATATTYAANVTNLKGGKPYRLRAQVASAAGSSTAEYETPYVREFEKIAGKVKVGAYYYAWYSKVDWQHVGVDANGSTANGTPLLGLYSSNDPVLIAKHIDWATGHGIDFFVNSWSGPNSNTDIALKQNILQNQLIGDIGFCVVSDLERFVGSQGKIDFNDSDTLNSFLGGMSYLARNYLLQPNYVRVGGRPLIFLYHEHEFDGNMESVMEQARETVRVGVGEAGVKPLLVHIHVGGEGNVLPKYDWFEPYDAVSGWVNLDWVDKSRNDPYHEIETEQFDSAWRLYAEHLGKGFIPLAEPGFRAPKHPDWPVLTKSPDRFAKQIGIALNSMDSSQILLIYSFNEWFEGAQIEPSVEDSFKYLQTLRDTLAGH